MQYLLTQEEFDSRADDAKAEYRKKNHQNVEYIQKVIKWAAAQSSFGETLPEAMNRMFREIGHPPE